MATISKSHISHLGWGGSHRTGTGQDCIKRHQRARMHPWQVTHRPKLSLPHLRLGGNRLASLEPGLAVGGQDQGQLCLVVFRFRTGQVQVRVRVRVRLRLGQVQGRLGLGQARFRVGQIRLGQVRLGLGQFGFKLGLVQARLGLGQVQGRLGQIRLGKLRLIRLGLVRLSNLLK